MHKPLGAGAACAALLATAGAWADPARLSGVVISGDDRVALFATHPDEGLLTLREGDRLGEDRVAAIAAGQVRLEGPGGTRSLTLGNDAATRAAAAAAIPKPAPYLDPYRRERETENDQ